METAILVVVVAHLVFSLALAALGRRSHGDGLTKRARRRSAYAAQSAAYAEKLGGTGAEKLGHALHAFRLLDEADNGRRDYSDAEARLAIEAALPSSVRSE